MFHSVPHRRRLPSSHPSEQKRESHNHDENQNARQEDHNHLSKLEVAPRDAGYPAEPLARVIKRPSCAHRPRRGSHLKRDIVVRDLCRLHQVIGVRRRPLVVL